MMRNNLQMIVGSMKEEHAQRLRRSWKEIHVELSMVKRLPAGNYREHSLDVAGTVLEITHDPSVLIIALLHDISQLREWESMLASLPLHAGEREAIREASTLQSFMLATSVERVDQLARSLQRQPVLFPIGIAHRLADMRRMKELDPDGRRLLATEGRQLIASLAGRMGMNIWRQEIEDIAFRILEPAIAKEIELLRRNHLPDDLLCLTHAKDYLQTALRRAGIRSSLNERIKGSYSSYKKMSLLGCSYDQLYDRLAMRVIVPTVEDCYRALGIIHSLFRPMLEKTKDYVGAPKGNGYQSIHTVIQPLPGIVEKQIEFQIRTEEMHEACEYGAHAHGSYKNRSYLSPRPRREEDALSSLQLFKSTAVNPPRFSESFHAHMNGNTISVYRGNGTVIALPKPATALDFACTVYKRKCKYIRTIRINGRERWIGTELVSGDTIEVRFARTEQAHSTWIHLCHQPDSRMLLKSLLEPREKVAVRRGAEKAMNGT